MLTSDIDKHVEEAQELVKYTKYKILLVSYYVNLFFKLFEFICLLQLEQMELEVVEIAPSQRQWCKSKLDCYRAELKRLNLEFTKAKMKNTSGYDSVDEYSDIRMPEEQKQRLLDNSEKIERTGKKLEEGYRIILETQDIGANILQDLDHQRETIQKTRQRVCYFLYTYFLLCNFLVMLG